MISTGTSELGVVILLLTQHERQNERKFGSGDRLNCEVEVLKLGTKVRYDALSWLETIPRKIIESDSRMMRFHHRKWA